MTQNLPRSHEERIEHENEIGIVIGIRIGRRLRVCPLGEAGGMSASKVSFQLEYADRVLDWTASSEAALRGGTSYIRSWISLQEFCAHKDCSGNKDKMVLVWPKTRSYFGNGYLLAIS